MTATTPASRALARIDAMTALDAPVAEYYVAAPAPLLALARAAVAQEAAEAELVAAREALRDSGTDEAATRYMDAGHAVGIAEADYDAATDALIAALAGEVDDGQ